MNSSIPKKSYDSLVSRCNFLKNIKALLILAMSSSLAKAEDWKEWDLPKLIKVSEEKNRVSSQELKEQLYLGYCYTKRAEEESDEHNKEKEEAGTEFKIATEASVIWVEGNQTKNDLRLPYKGRASFGGSLDRVKEKSKNYDFFDKQAALLKNNSPYIVFNKKDNYWIFKNNEASVEFVDEQLQQVDEFVVLWWAASESNAGPELVGNWSRVYHDVNNSKAVSKTESLGFCHYPGALKFN